MTSVPDRFRARVEPVDIVLRPFQVFARLEASSGLLLVLAAGVALVWANSPWSDSYDELWATRIAIFSGDAGLTKPLILWINDGLMAIFFLVVGLEIKRELLVGELASVRRAALPMIAAAGGMAIPAAIYLAVNAGSGSPRGWAIPVATDIAFSLGVLALLGSRVPAAMKTFLTALAIADDIGGILVIGLAFTESLAWVALLSAMAIFLVLVLAGRLGVRSPIVYGILGVALWYALLKSGVHATLAGVLLAIAIPARTRIDGDEFVTEGRALLDHFERSSAPGKNVLSNDEQQDAVQSLETSISQVQTPLQRIEHALHPWVVFGIMPLFALANAGVTIGGDFFSLVAEPVTIGVLLGLMIGKPLGITLAVWLATLTRAASLPSGISFRQIHALSWLAGIGFTLSLFIAELAFTDEAHLAQAKVGILAGSVLAAATGAALLLVIKPRRNSGPPSTARAA